MKRLVLAAAMVVGMTGMADAKLSAAELSSMSCDSAEVNLPTIVGGEARAHDPSIYDVRADLKKYQTRYFPYFKQGVAGCKDAKRRNRATAIYNSDIAAARHLLDASDDWLTTMNLANQQLARCVTDYHGTTKGAECQTRLEENIKLKIKWQATP